MGASPRILKRLHVRTGGCNDSAPRLETRATKHTTWTNHSYPVLSSFPPNPHQQLFLLPLDTAGRMWQDSSAAAYGASSSQYYPQQHVAPQPGVPLQFYAPSPVGSTFYSGSRSSLEGHVNAQGSIQQGGGSYTGNIQPAGGWWTAFGTGGFEGEPPLLEGACYLSSSSL